VNGAHRLFQCLLVLWPLSAGAQQMPPYPDVWELQFPNAVPGSSLHASLLNDGQVVVAYLPDGPAGKAPRVERLFFGGGSVKEERLPDGQYVFTYADGRHTTVSSHDNFREALPDGRTIRNSYNEYRDCYRGPAREYVVITGENRRPQVSKVFFYLLDEPQRFTTSVNDNWRGLDTGPSCPTEPSLDLEVNVESIGGSFLPLSDGTILLLDHQHGLVIRLTRDLDSPSNLMNNRVFAFPYNESYLFVDLLLGKDYGNGEEKSIRFQEALDDLRDHLRKIKNEQLGIESPVKAEDGKVAERSGVISTPCVRNDHGIFEDINCAVEARDAADRELNAVYKALLARLGPSEEKRLRQAQRTWLEFVQADARFTIEREGDGSSGRLIAINYQEQLIRQRAEALKSWLP
jgi:uncharacterized protein YecT (DUF1311 family)